MAMGTTCAVHVHRSWVPLEIHHILPLGLGGPNKAENKCSVCSNGHGQVHEFIRLLTVYGGKVPWLKALRFGRKVRALATRGYSEWLANKSG